MLFFDKDFVSLRLENFSDSPRIWFFLSLRGSAGVLNTRRALQLSYQKVFQVGNASNQAQAPPMHQQLAHPHVPRHVRPCHVGQRVRDDDDAPGRVPDHVLGDTVFLASPTGPLPSTE